MAKKKTSVEDYIAAHPDPVAQLLTELRALVLETLPQAKLAMKWGVPTVFDPPDRPLIYLYGGKAHMHLGFVNGADLPDPEGLLQGRGPSGRHVVLKPGVARPDAALAELIGQAASG